MLDHVELLLVAAEGRGIDRDGLWRLAVDRRRALLLRLQSADCRLRLSRGPCCAAGELGDALLRWLLCPCRGLRQRLRLR